MRTKTPVAKLVQLGLPLICFWMAAPALSQDLKHCAGPNLTRHKIENFDFETNSRVERYSGEDQYKFRIISCASNNDKEFPVFIDWRIPKRTGWVPAGEAVDGVPTLIVKNNVEQLTACLQYGNQGEFTSAPFFGTDADKKALDSEADKGCRAAASSSKNPGKTIIEEIKDIILVIRNYFPSDVNSPSSTMLQINAEVGIRKTGTNQYQSFFNYYVTPYKDSKGGVIKSITIKPSFTGDTEGLLGSFLKKHQNPIGLEEKGIITFDVSGIENPSLRYARYEFYSEKNQLLAAIELPVYVSLPPALVVKTQ